MVIEKNKAAKILFRLFLNNEKSLNVDATQPKVSIIQNHPAKTISLFTQTSTTQLYLTLPPPKTSPIVAIFGVLQYTNCALQHAR